MGNRATKFWSRAPRYTLRPTDNRYFRYARQNEPGQTYTTQFVDVSQSGLAFVCDPDHAPRISDLIKVEIPIGHENHTVAWWARVVRIQEYTPKGWFSQSNDEDLHQVLVAVTFHELPPGHSRAIRVALDEKFEELIRDKRQRHWLKFAKVLTSNSMKILLYGAAIIATIWLLHFLTEPVGNYDPQKGAPWGERFPNMPLKPGRLGD